MRLFLASPARMLPASSQATPETKLKRPGPRPGPPTSTTGSPVSSDMMYTFWRPQTGDSNAVFGGRSSRHVYPDDPCLGNGTLQRLQDSSATFGTLINRQNCSTQTSSIVFAALITLTGGLALSTAAFGLERRKRRSHGFLAFA